MVCLVMGLKLVRNLDGEFEAKRVMREIIRAFGCDRKQLMG